MPLNIPNVLTWMRILLIPLVIGVFYAPLSVYEQNLIATSAFIVAAVTDWFEIGRASCRVRVFNDV